MLSRTRIGRIAMHVLVGTTTLVGLIACPRSADAKRNGMFSASATITQDTRVHVHVRRGDVVVRAGTGSIVQVTAQVRDCSDQGDLPGRYTPAEIIAYLERTPPIEQDGKDLRIGAMLHEDFHLGVEIDYEIVMPPWVDLDIDAEHGKLDVVDVGQRIHVDKSSGATVIQEPSGRLQVDCGEGSLQVFGTPRDEWSLQSTVGKVEVIVPGNLGFELDAETKQGTFESEIPLVVEKPGRYDGAVNGGGPKIHIRSEQGPIIIWQKQ
jgi:hypothetical protein